MKPLKPLLIPAILVIALSVTPISVNAGPAKPPTPAAMTDQKSPVLGASRQIDRLVAQAHALHEVTPNPPASDAVFVRRIHLDLIGRLPTKQETLSFLNDQSPDKRSALIDSLLHSEGYVAHHFNYWADILRAKTQISGNGQSTPAGLSYAAWIRESLRDNKPYDQFVKEMLSASGSSWENPAIGYYLRDYGMPLDNLAITSQVFLGTQIVCAQCHDHPFDDWSQMDYFHLAAFTNGQVTTNQSPNGRAAFELASKNFQKKNGKAMPTEKRRDLQRSFSEILKPVRFNNVFETNRPLRLPHDYQYDDAKPRSIVPPSVPFAPGAAVSKGEVPIHAFAEWVTSPENPRFTKVIANRLWKKAFGVGLIEPVDDLREDTEASNPELMAFLEKKMVDFDYDMKRFLRMIYHTETYQREASSEAPIWGLAYHFPGPILRRMTAEQLWDSIVAMTFEDPDAPDAEFELYTERRLTEVQLIANAVYEQKPGQLLRNGYEIAQVQRELSGELQRTQEALAAARESKDSLAIRKASQDAQRIRRQLAVEVENRVFREGLEERLTLVASNAPDDEEFLADLAETLRLEGETVSEGMNSLLSSDNNGIVRQLVNAMMADEQAALRQTEKERRDQERIDWQVDRPDKRKSYAAFTEMREKLKRSAYLPSPAPGGHFLREFGQSDREVVENASTDASITQALALLNGRIIGAMTNRYSVMGRELVTDGAFKERLDTIFLSMLNRYPTPEERKILSQAWSEAEGDEASIQGLVWTVLNMREFLFVQ